MYSIHDPMGITAPVPTVSVLSATLLPEPTVAVRAVPRGLIYVLKKLGDEGRTEVVVAVRCVSHISGWRVRVYAWPIGHRML